jgi:predicted dehydrogenase
MRAPKLNYLPRGPRRRRQHRIGLIGCGGISLYHLTAAKSLGVEVVAMADVNLAAAEGRRAEFFPQADVYTDHHELLARDDINVVEIATHTAVRGPQIYDALKAGKHVLSQKPFTFDLAEARRLTNYAKRRGLRLGINQNGRWSPQFGALIAAKNQGLLGEVHSLDFSLAWDHTWTRGTPFENLHHLLLNDFAIHWLDATACVFGDRRPKSVFASAVKAPGQDMKPPMIANTTINYGDGLAMLGFSAYEGHDPREYMCCVGSKGTIRGIGNVNKITEIEFANAKGTVKIPLEGNWFPDGFRGTLGEFLRAVEEDREPSNSARNNIGTLELCFAVVASADTGQPVKPGTVKSIRM